MCVYNDSGTLKIWPLSSPLSSKMEIIAITTVLLSCRMPLKLILFKKKANEILRYCYESCGNRKKPVTFLSGVQGQGWALKLSSTPSKAGQVNQNEKGISATKLHSQSYC